MTLEPGKTYDCVTDTRRKGGGQLVYRLKLLSVQWKTMPASGWGGGRSRGTVWVVGIDVQVGRVSIPMPRIMEIKEVSAK